LCLADAQGLNGEWPSAMDRIAVFAWTSSLLKVIDVGAAPHACAHVRRDARRRVARDIAEIALAEAHRINDVAVVILHHIHRGVAVLEIVIRIRGYRGVSRVTLRKAAAGPRQVVLCGGWCARKVT
jgi:hypothetical protein